MFRPYRRPTVAVVGAGVAGCSAAAECAFSGFDTTLFDRQPTLGGHLSSGSVALSRRAHYRTPYLKKTKVDGTSSALVEHLSAAIGASGAVFRGSTNITHASFDEAEGQWELTLNDTQTEKFDVLIRATGEASPWIEVPGRKNFNADDLYHHLGVEVVGLPNCLFVDTEYPSNAQPVERSFAVAEMRGGYARRYLRQLEIRGPGALSVKQDRWLVQPGTLRGARAAISDFEPDTHVFVRARNYAAEERRPSKTPV